MHKAQWNDRAGRERATRKKFGWTGRVVAVVVVVGCLISTSNECVVTSVVQVDGGIARAWLDRHG